MSLVTDTSTATPAAAAAPAAAVAPAADAGTPAAAPAADTTITSDGAPKSNTDGAPADTKPKAEGDKVEPMPKGAPEKYGDFKLPEGIAIAPEILGKFTGVAKELNLTQEQAQKLVELTSENAIAKAKAQDAALEQQKQSWIKGLKEDKEYGGDKYNETVERAKRTFKAFGNAELKTILDSSMLGDHPVILKLFATIDRKIGEDKVVDGKPPAATERSAAEVIYGKK